MESQQQYEMRERAGFYNDMRRVSSQPLADRRESRSTFAGVMATDPEVIAERIGWIINGSYGRGAYVVGREVLSKKRMNRPAWFVQTVAALEWQCPPDFAVDAWKKLTPSQKAKLDAAVKKELASAEREIAEEEKRHPTKTRKASKNGARRKPRTKKSSARKARRPAKRR